MDSSLSSGVVPFRVEPRFVERVWGFKDLRPWFDRVAEGGPLGEVWLTGDECLVATGPHAGKTLGGLFAEIPEALLGRRAGQDGAGLLIKVLFAREKLSVQVHPDDPMARKYGEPRGKTECWYALAAEPGAQVACGLKPGVTMTQIKDEIQAGTLEESLNALDVAPHDMIYVDAGTVHAVWPGSILLETQQNCDLTYRMYDYGRGRELHIEKSLEATKLVTDAGKIAPKVLKDRTILLDVKYFRIERIPVSGSISSAGLADGDKPEPELTYLFAAAGAGRLTGAGFEAVDLPARGIVAVPASAPPFILEDAGGLELIRMTPNWPEKAQ
ncbi:MAG: type I phosphomannose isomerase catalytic subunit [Terracidiphilus sp.]